MPFTVSPLRTGGTPSMLRAPSEAALAFRQHTGMGTGQAQRQRARAAGGGGGLSTLAGVAELFDPETGLPNRLPRNAQEAALFQLQGARAAAGLQRQATRSALATLRFGVGMTQRASPYSLAGALSPLLSQQAQIQASEQFQSPDFSYFLRPDAYGGGARGGGLSLGGVAQRVPSPIGLQFQPEGAGGFAAGFGGGAGGQVFGPLQPMLQPGAGVPGAGGGLFDFGMEGGGYEGPGGGGLFGDTRGIADIGQGLFGGGAASAGAAGAAAFGAGTSFVPGAGGFGGQIIGPGGEVLATARGG